MSQHNPGQQWGAQPQGYGQPPQGYGQQPQPPKKMGAGKKIGLGCLSIIGLFVLIGIIAAVASSGSDGDDSSSKGSSATAPKEGGGKAEEKKEEAPDSPIKVTATPTDFTPSILHSGGDYTSVEVKIVNDSDETIDVNPLYFAITDTDGTKHSAELGMDERQIDTVKLAPGENVTGVITGKGSFKAKTVTYTDGLIGDSVRADVK